MKNRGIMLDRGKSETALAQIVTILNGTNAELDKVGISLSDFIKLVISDITAIAGIFKSKNFEANYREHLSDFIYPVGSYYETSLSVDDFNPNNCWAGDWMLEKDEKGVGGGMVHVSAGINTENNTQYELGEVGGEEDVALTIENIPKHRHEYTKPSGSTNAGDSGSAVSGTDSAYTSYVGGENGEGATIAHNNMQPYVVINRWHRIS